MKVMSKCHPSLSASEGPQDALRWRSGSDHKEVLGTEIEPIRAEVAHPILLGLPVLAGPHVQARQPAVAVCPGVDADRMAEVKRPSCTLLRVAADHDLP